MFRENKSTLYLVQVKLNLSDKKDDIKLIPWNIAILCVSAFCVNFLAALLNVIYVKWKVWWLIKFN